MAPIQQTEYRVFVVRCSQSAAGFIADLVGIVPGLLHCVQFDGGVNLHVANTHHYSEVVGFICSLLEAEFYGHRV